MLTYSCSISSSRYLPQSSSNDSMVGTNGGGNYFLMSRSQSISVNQGCEITSLASSQKPPPILLTGSFSSNLESRSQARSENSDLRSIGCYMRLNCDIKLTFWIFFLRYQRLETFGKGNSPERHSYMRMPRHHQSTDLLCGWQFSISGAMQSSVPQNVEVCLSFFRPLLEIPKSVNLTQPSEPIRMFSGFKSLYAIPF